MPPDLSSYSDEELDALERKAKGGRPSARPVYTPMPRTPTDVDREGRDIAAGNRDDVRTGIAARGEGRDIKKMGFDHARDLRTEFARLPDVQDYRAAIKAYSTALKTDETPAGDLNLIYAFAKIMDPGSVVREGEQAAVAGGDSLAGQIEARLKKELGESGTFRPEYRNQLRWELQNRVAELNTAYQGQRAQYSNFASQLGVDPDVVIGQHDGLRFENEIKDYWLKQGVPVVPEARDEQGNPLPSGARVPQTKGPPSLPPDYRGSYLGQGMSGVNEGIANTFGVPVDVATAVMNLLPRGINAAANTNIPTIENPVGGSDWIKGLMGGWGIYAPTQDSGKQFARRVGESIGGALLPAGATANTARQFGGALLSAAGGGIGGAAAQQTFPGNPMAEFVGELAGGGAVGTGLLAGSRRAAQRRIESGIPTVDQLKARAGEKYREAESRGITADPAMTQDLADQLRQSLIDEGRITPDGQITEVYPKVREAIRLTDGYAGQPMTPTQMQPVRSVIADGMTSLDANERRMSRNLTSIFDDWSSPQAPELAQARDISSRYLNAQQLERARELAAARAGQFSGSGFENALRTEYRGLDRANIRAGGRYAPAMDQAIQNVSRGTPASNAARAIGRFAPTGPVSGVLGTGGPAALGTMVGGPVAGLAAGATAAGVGTAGRVAATQMGIRNADIAELIARNGGPIEQAPMVDPETQRIIAAMLATQQGTLLRAPRKPKRKQR